MTLQEVKDMQGLCLKGVLGHDRIRAEVAGILNQLLIQEWRRRAPEEFEKNS